MTSYKSDLFSKIQLSIKELFTVNFSKYSEGRPEVHRLRKILQKENIPSTEKWESDESYKK